jgi:hypothetical protein
MAKVEKAKVSHWVYMAGIILFGLGYSAIKQKVESDLLFIGAGIVYLFLFSLLAKLISSKVSNKKAK